MTAIRRSFFSQVKSSDQKGDHARLGIISRQSRYPASAVIDSFTHERVLCARIGRVAQR